MCSEMNPKDIEYVQGWTKISCTDWWELKGRLYYSSLVHLSVKFEIDAVESRLVKFLDYVQRWSKRSTTTGCRLVERSFVQRWTQTSGNTTTSDAVDVWYGYRTTSRVTIYGVDLFPLTYSATYELKLVSNVDHHWVVCDEQMVQRHADTEMHRP